MTDEVHPAKTNDGTNELILFFNLIIILEAVYFDTVELYRELYWEVFYPISFNESRLNIRNSCLSYTVGLTILVKAC